MRRIRKNPFSAVLLLMLSVLLLSVQDNGDIIAKAEEALKASNSRELAKYLHDRLEIKLDNERKEYSSNQAEIVLKQFFQKHPSDDTEIIHQGDSPGGIIYAIGKYTSGTTSYRVVLRAKKYRNVYKIYRLEFSKDR